jgi:hypothetical protein
MAEANSAPNLSGAVPDSQLSIAIMNDPSYKDDYDLAVAKPL